MLTRIYRRATCNCLEMRTHMHTHMPVHTHTYTHVQYMYMYTLQCILLLQDQSLPTLPGVPSSTTASAMEQPPTSAGVPLPFGDAHNMAMGQLATATGTAAVQGGGSGGLEGVAGSELPGVGGGVVGAGGSDQQILKQHELALQRLEELQGDMIGGEKGGMVGHRRPQQIHVYLSLFPTPISAFYSVAPTFSLLRTFLREVLKTRNI